VTAPTGSDASKLVTPTGELIMSAEQMFENHAGWLTARRWRRPVDQGTRLDHDDLTDNEWKRLGYRIGSSDVPSILDLDGVDTPAHVYRDKVLGVGRPPNEAMAWGHIFEPAIAGEWQRRNRTAVDEIGLVARVGAPWHQSTIDRRVRECPLVPGLRDGCGLEVKNVGYASASRWHADIPDRILAQIVHQLYVTGYPHMHYACNIGGNMMRQGVVYADREAKLMTFVVEQVDTFRREHLLTGVEPLWDTSAKAAKLIELDMMTHPVRAGELDIDGIGEVMAYAQASADESAAKKRKEAAKARLAQIANGMQQMMFADLPAYRYGETKRTDVDLDKLRERYPDAYADPEVVKQKKGYTLYIDKAYKVKKGAS
jgi:predicted phage-related endonuclease